MDREKIGVGIVTCGRPELFKKLFESLQPCKEIIDYICLVEDTKYPNPEYKNYIREIYLDNWKGDNSLLGIVSDENMGVAKSKNRALEVLLKENCNHIFIIEDDMIIKNPNVFQKYIDLSKISGVEHLMFGYHGPANKNNIPYGPPQPRLVVKYDDEFSIALNPHCVGAFCYYTKKSLESCGLFDERFRNAFDHVEHSYRLAIAGYSTPYWWWSDLANSQEYIDEQECSSASSTIKTPESLDKWENNIQQSMKLFYEKHNKYPFSVGGVEDTPENEVLKILKQRRNR